MINKALGYQTEYQESTLTAQDIRALPGLTLLEFGTAWCQHCQAASQAVKKALEAYPTLHHIKLIDGKGKRLGRAYQVKQWPTFIYLQNGEELGRLVRPRHSESIQQLLAKNRCE